MRVFFLKIIFYIFRLFLYLHAENNFFKQNIYYFIIFLNKTPLYKAKTLHGVFIFIAEGVLFFVF